MSDNLAIRPRRPRAITPDLWCIVYGCLTIGVSDAGLTLYIAPAPTLKLIDVTKEELPCIVNF